MWKRVSSYGDEQMVLQSVTYEWSGGEPDPGQLPEGYRQLPHDKTRARRSLQPGDRLVRAVVGILAICIAILVLRSL
jgi:hypothetical protein